MLKAAQEKQDCLLQKISESDEIKAQRPLFHFAISDS